MLNHSGKELFFQSIKSDCEVDDVDPDEYLWKEIRISNLSKHEDSKLVIVVNILISELHHWHVIYCLYLLCKYRI